MNCRLHPRFLLVLVAWSLVVVPVRAQDKPCEWRDVARIVAVGDVHGDVDQLIKCLRVAGVIDEKNRWVGGKTHLVQVGDIFDRGPTSKQAMDLLMTLEPQAEKAGGRVHALLGNHEAMILAARYSYLQRDEAAAYGGMVQFEKAMKPEGAYGKWIRSHNAAIKINDILFLHAGLSADYAAMPLKEINEQVIQSLSPGSGGAADDPAGPLWYRGLAGGDEDKVKELLDIVLEKHGARHIVVGHTVTPPPLGIKTRVDGGIIMIDVGMSRTYRQGPAMCLLVEDGRFFAVAEDVKVDLEIDQPASPPATVPEPEPAAAED